MTFSAFALELPLVEEGVAFPLPRVPFDWPPAFLLPRAVPLVALAALPAPLPDFFELPAAFANCDRWDDVVSLAGLL